MQTSFLGLVECGERQTLDGLSLELWKYWNEGNTAYTTRKINLLVSKMVKRIGNMATKPESAVPDNKFFWVNVGVTEEDIPRIDECFPTPEITFRLLTGVLVDGLKVSFSLNAKNDLTVCSLSDRRTDSPTFGACLTGAADGWYDSLCVCLYKYTTLLHGDLANGSTSNEPRRRIM